MTYYLHSISHHAKLSHPLLERGILSELLNVEVFDTLWEAKVLTERWRREYQPATASQRLGLSAAGTRGQITQAPGPEFYPMEWTSNGPRSNLEGGLVPGGQVICHSDSTGNICQHVS